MTTALQMGEPTVDARLCIDLISDPERRQALLAELATGEIGF